ncbi:MAG: hypothetical protein OEN48_12145 [Betaproteobacteria bacterium]|nr:hypothetical protein [Gammaproteobacteria bacterium]MDH3437724.1 hypothetical protein [Betaproteobacteria bacterium]
MTTLTPEVKAALQEAARVCRNLSVSSNFVARLTPQRVAMKCANDILALSDSPTFIDKIATAWSERNELLKLLEGWREDDGAGHYNKLRDIEAVLTRTDQTLAIPDVAETPVEDEEIVCILPPEATPESPDELILEALLALREEGEITQEALDENLDMEGGRLRKLAAQLKTKKSDSESE